MEVTAIDVRVATGPWWFVPKYTGPVTGVTRFGAVHMTNVDSMVRNVVGKLGRELLDRLNIVDHGNAEGIEIGDDWITAQNVSTFAPKLAHLGGRFYRKGFVHVQNCHAGANRELLIALAHIFMVPVYGGTGLEHGLFRANLGLYERCSPTAFCERQFFRP